MDAPDTITAAASPPGPDPGPHLRASLLLQAPVPLDRLPSDRAGPADDAPGTSRRAVAAVARELNELLAPLISQLESATPAK